MDLLPDAISYPLRGQGVFFVGRGVFMILFLPVCLASIFVCGPLSLVVVLFGMAYFAAHHADVVQSTVTGRNLPPDLPFVSDIIDDLGRPLLAALLAILISFMPLFVYVWNVKSSYLPLLLCFGEGEHIARETAVAFGLECLGWLYFSMAWLGFVIRGEVWFVLPHRVLPAIARALPGCLLVTGVPVGAALACRVLKDGPEWLAQCKFPFDFQTSFVADHPMAFLAFATVSGVMRSGEESWSALLFLTFLSSAPWLFVIHARLLGLCYRKSTERLGW